MNKKEEIEFDREEKMYVKLPLLIKEIIYSSMIPLPTIKECVINEIEEIKKITNAECDSALEFMKKHNHAFKE